MAKQPGLSLLDLAPQRVLIDIGEGQQLRVRGLSVKTIMKLVERYPLILEWFKGGAKIEVEEVKAVAPDAIAAVIALAAGEAGKEDEAAEIAADLPIETQLDILEAIAGLTFRSGFGPFAQRMAAIARLSAAVSGNSGKAPDTNSQPPSKPSQPSGAAPAQSST